LAREKLMEAWGDDRSSLAMKPDLGQRWPLQPQLAEIDYIRCPAGKLREPEAARRPLRLPRIFGAKRLGNDRDRRVYSVLWRVAGRGFLGLALVSVAVEYFLLIRSAFRRWIGSTKLSAPVAFTDQFDVGLRLAEAGAVPRLYISGVNGNAGMDPLHFVEQLSIRNPDIADLGRLVACCAEWGKRAKNTFQNAQDTKCWVDRSALTGPILLITSRQAMARAITALSGALPEREIIPYPVEDGAPRTAGQGCAHI
jgi:hypothetical protein